MTEARQLSAPTVLLIDCETSGLYLDRLSIDDNQQPWCPSLAAALCTADGQMVQFCNFLIKAEGRSIKEGALKVHGITARAASQLGIPESRALGVLSDLLKTAPMDSYVRIVTFGDLDFRVIASLFARFAVSQNKPSNSYDRLWLSRPLVERIDLQKPWCQQVCKIESDFDSGEFRWPSLDDARETILGWPRRTGLHDAWADMLALKSLYFHFAEKGCFNAV